MTPLEMRAIFYCGVLAIVVGSGLWLRHVGYEAGKAECQAASDQAKGLRDGQQAILDKIAGTDNAQVADNVAALSRKVDALAKSARPQVVKVFPPGCVASSETVRDVNAAR